MPTYFITGASRGLGLELATQLLASSPEIRVIAAVRNPATSTELQSLIKANEGRIEAVTLDVTDVVSIKSGVAEAAKSALAKDGIDVLVNNAGVFAGGWAAPTATSIPDLNENLASNLVGPIHVTLELLPLLRQGKAKQIFTTSSLVGSLGGIYSQSPAAVTYAISKAAINMWLVKLSKELAEEGFTVVPYHPGYVKTDLTGGPDGPADIYKEESIEKTLKNVFFNVTPADNGKFFDYKGDNLPW